ncbi:MAG: YveK family protein [Acutalibacteraceae bacterium]
MKKDISINDILKIFLSHIKLIVLIVVIFGIASFLYSKYMITPMYTTSTLLYVTNSDSLPGEQDVENNNTSATSAANTSGKSGANDIVISARIASVCQTLFKTDIMMQELIEYLDLNVSTGQLKGMIGVSAVEDTQFITVTITSANPETAAAIANALPKAAQSTYKFFFPYGKIVVANPAHVPSSPSSPNVPKNTLFGAGAGLVLALILSFIIEIIDTTVKPDDDLYKIYNIPVFAAIPEIETDAKSKKAYAKE